MPYLKMPAFVLSAKDPFHPTSIERALRCSVLVSSRHGRTMPGSASQRLTKEMIRNEHTAFDCWNDLRSTSLKLVDPAGLTEYKYAEDAPIYVRTVSDDEHGAHLTCMYLMNGVSRRRCLWWWRSAPAIDVVRFDMYYDKEGELCSVLLPTADGNLVMIRCRSDREFILAIDPRTHLLSPFRGQAERSQLWSPRAQRADGAPWTQISNFARFMRNDV